MKNLRNTRYQNDVFTILSETDNALPADTIIAKMPAKVNKTTIYRILEKLVAHGKVHFITGEKGKAYYALCTSCNEQHTLHSHIHFQCRVCSAVYCLPNTIEVPALEEFIIEETQFLLLGCCKICQ